MDTIKLAAPAHCNFCDETARYDDKTKAGPWSYMCEAHEAQYGVGIGFVLEYPQR